MTGQFALGAKVYGLMARAIPAFDDKLVPPPPETLGRFIRWALADTYKVLGVAAFASILVGLSEILTAFLLGYVIDTALEADATRLFTDYGWQFLWIGVFLVLARPVIFGVSAAFQAVTLQSNLNVLVLSRLHRWTLGQDVTFFDNDFAGRIAQKQMQTARALTEATTETVNTILFVFSSFLASAVLVMTIDLRVGLVLGAWLAVYLAFISYFLPRFRARAERRASARAAVSGQIVDTITNIKTVILFAHVKHEDSAAIGSMGHYRNRTLEFGYLSAGFRYFLMVIAGILPMVMVGLTLWLWTKGLVTPGEIATTGALAIRVSQMTGFLSFTLMNIYSSVGEIEDGMRTLATPHRLAEKPEPLVLPLSREIQFEDVSFAYGRQTGGVDGLNLRIQAGEKIGVVGASGAGKSTLVSLLLRLYDAEHGRVLVGGHDVRDVTQESLRRNIGMVTQETSMFNRTALENIRYGRPDATMEDVEAAAKRAEALEFIHDLRDYKGRVGFDAFLGERGVKLSGGQRQRIALARAMLKDAPILVLDEATSALDSEVEASIQAALEQAMKGKTVIAIAHRLSTIARMDRVVVLDGGRIVEDGTHSELLGRNGLYARYWNRQSGGFIGIDEHAAE